MLVAVPSMLWTKWNCQKGHGPPVYVKNVPQENATKPTNSHAGLKGPLHSSAVAHFSKTEIVDAM